MYKSFIYTKIRLKIFQVLYFAQKIDTKQVQMCTVKEQRKQGKRRQKTHETWEPWMTESRSLKCLNKETLKRGLSLREYECHELVNLPRLHSKAAYSWKWVGKSHGQRKTELNELLACLGISAMPLTLFFHGGKWNYEGKNTTVRRRDPKGSRRFRKVRLSTGSLFWCILRLNYCLD